MSNSCQTMESPTNIDASPAPSRQPRSLLALVVRNSAYVLAAQVGIKLLAFLFNVYVVRRLGDVNYGKYATVMAYVGIFAIFTDFGMAPYAVREIARDWDQARHLFPNIAAIRLILSVLVIMIAGLVAGILGYSRDIVTGVLIAGAGVGLYALAGPADAILVARERLDYSSLLNLLNQLIFIVTGTGLLLLGWDFLGLVIANQLGVLGITLLGVWIIFKQVKLRDLHLNLQQWKTLMLASLPFGVAGLASVLAQQFDTVLLSLVKGEQVVGWYMVSYNLLLMMMLLARSVAMSLYPSLVREHKQDPESLARIVPRTVKYMLLISLPIATGTVAIGDQLIVTLYTAELMPSVTALRILAWALPVMFLAEILGRTSAVLNYEKKVARIGLILGLVNVGANLLLAPTFGLVGASLAAVLAAFLLLIAYIRLLSLNLTIGTMGFTLARMVLAALLMGATVHLAGLGLGLSIGLGACTYVALLFVLRVVNEKEIQTVYRLALRHR